MASTIRTKPSANRPIGTIALALAGIWLANPGWSDTPGPAGGLRSPESGNMSYPPRLRWVSPDGRLPGTYAEYLAKHPLRSASFANARTIVPSSGPRSQEGGIGILVDAALEPQIEGGLAQYVADLTAAGYTAYVEAVSGGTPEEVRAWVASRYAAGDEGIVFVGDITAAWAVWENETFPCDLYYMDTDGHWEDADQDGVYETHAAGAGDEAPEVYLARMYTPTLLWNTEASMVNAYFAKAHAYRTGALRQPWRGLEYIDDPWFCFSYNLSEAYGDHVFRCDVGEFTTGPDYLAKLAQGYHFVHICAHSNSWSHSFGTWPTYSVAYAHVYVHSPIQRTARLLLGSDDGIKVWLNGTVIANHDVYDTWQQDQFTATVTLNAGWNRLLCKISQGGGDFGFSVRLASTAGGSLPDLRYQLDDPSVNGDDPQVEPLTHIGTWLLNGLYGNDNQNERLSHDYLKGEAAIHPSEGASAPAGQWIRVAQHPLPFELGQLYATYYSPGGSVSAGQIQHLDPPVLFYNLFACSAGRYTDYDYLSGSYIFNTSWGLGALASTKAGSMVNFPLFWEPLGDGLTLGRAYHRWWTALAPYDHELRGWIYGMTLTGDPTLPLLPPDCNANGLPDQCDLDCAFAPGGCHLPDCGLALDCNGNANPDDCDLAAGSSADCNRNSVPDECDIAGGLSADCTGNGVPDECEPDCNGNGDADSCDIAAGRSADCNLNDVLDECDLAGGVSADENQNAVPDECEPSVLGAGGPLAAWGNDNYGQCAAPVPNAGFVAVAGGYYHTLALRANGSIAAWGYNGDGQCTIAPNMGFVGIAAGMWHSLGLRADGSVAAVGSNYYGQCDVPALDPGFVAIAAGGFHSLGLKADGSVVAWGLSFDGQCNVPAPNAGFVAVGAGSYHSLGLKADGSIVAWGHNADHQCDVPLPNSGFIAVAGGGCHSLGLKAGGEIVGWGCNGHHQCDVPAPNAGFVGIGAGTYHSLGLKADGSIAAWGFNWYGQCNVPVPNAGFVAVAAGGWHSLGIHVLRGDLNCDGRVDFDDINPFVSALVSRAAYEQRYPRCYWLTGDIDADGDVSFDDIPPFVRCLVSEGCPELP